MAVEKSVKKGKESLPESEHPGREEHILVCLSSAPSNERVIRIAAQMAAAYHGVFTALFVETPDFAVASQENKERLWNNRQLAQELGAQPETIYGDDVPYQIAEYARISGVTHIVLGQSATRRKRVLGRDSLTEQLMLYAPQVEVHIIPDKNARRAYRPKRAFHFQYQSFLKNTIASMLILIGATLIGMMFYHLKFTSANIIMVYILAVLLTSAATSHQVYSLVSSIASVFIFNYLFILPRFSLSVYENGYPVTFVVMFLTAYITGNLANSYKVQAKQSAKVAYRTKILFDTNQLLTKAKDRDEIIRTAAEQLGKLLGRSIVIYPEKDGQIDRKACVAFPADRRQSPEYSAEAAAVEAEAINWVFRNNHSAGAGTDQYSDAQYRYLAIRVNDRVYGVFGVEAGKTPLDSTEYSILLSILGECALALESEKNAREKEAAAILAESEQLRANLLRTISHDLRTPLTAISGNASNLLYAGDNFDRETKERMYRDMYEDSQWLIELVENLLYATRIEEGRMVLKTSAELLSEIVEEALQHISHKAGKHRIETVYEDDLLLVQADAKLVVQVIINIVDNAIKYTQEDSCICISTGRKADMAEIRISDNGGGISDEDKKKIFDKFYCGNHKIADNRRSLGLGLFLCKSIVEAHGGEISVGDHLPTGTEFCFTLPCKEVTIYE